MCPLGRPYSGPKPVRRYFSPVSSELERDGRPAFKRVLLKLSGEALMGKQAYGTDPDRIHAIARTVRRVRGRGVEVAIVAGGGNIYRGLEGTAKGRDAA